MKQQFSIRIFEARDKDSVISLWEAVFPEDPPWNVPANIIQRKLSVQKELFFVCLRDQRVIGTVLAGFDGVRGWIHKLAVSPEYQRMGIASSLVGSAEEGLKELGCPKLNLQIRASNASVLKFYKSLGYSIEDRISMGKLLLEE